MTRFLLPKQPHCTGKKKTRDLEDSLVCTSVGAVGILASGLRPAAATTLQTTADTACDFTQHTTDAPAASIATTD